MKGLFIIWALCVVVFYAGFRFGLTVERNRE
jgi:hypothetical protein